MLGSMEMRTPLGGRPRDGRHCDLCGCSQPAVRCDKCGCQIFCLSCDDMYHRHPKRRFHLRKAVDPTPPIPQARPVLPLKVSHLATTNPGDPSKMPLPPPRKKKSIFGSFKRGSASSDNSPPLPKKEYSWTDRFGSIKKFMSNRPLPPLPTGEDNDMDIEPTTNGQTSVRGDLSFIHKKVEEKPPQLPQRSYKPSDFNQFGPENENHSQSPPRQFPREVQNGAVDHNTNHMNQSWGNPAENWRSRTSVPNGQQSFGTLRPGQPGIPPRGGLGFQGGIHQSSSATDLQNIHTAEGFVNPSMPPHYPHYPMNPHLPPHYPYPMYPQYPNYPQYFGNSFANLSNQQTTDGDVSDRSDVSSRHPSKKQHFRKRAKRSQSVMAYPGQLYPFGPFPGYGPWGVPVPMEAPPSPAGSVKSLNRSGRSRRRKKLTSEDDDEEFSMSSSPMSRPKSSSSDRAKNQKRSPLVTQTTTSDEESDGENNNIKNKVNTIQRRVSDPPVSSSPLENKSSMQDNAYNVRHSDVEVEGSSPTVNARRPSMDSDVGDRFEEPAAPSPVIPSSRWECTHCTFLNPVDNKICQVCCKTNIAASDSPSAGGSRSASAAADRRPSASSERDRSPSVRRLDNDDVGQKEKRDMDILNSALDEAEKEISRGLEELIKLRDDIDTSEVKKESEPEATKAQVSQSPKPVYKSSGRMRTSILDKLNLNKQQTEKPKTVSTSTDTQTEANNWKADKIIEARRHSNSSTTSDAYNSPLAQSPELPLNKKQVDSSCQTQQDNLFEYLEQKKAAEEAFLGRPVNNFGFGYNDRFDRMASPVPIFDRYFGGGYGGMMQRSHSRASLFAGRLNDPMEYGPGFGYGGMYRSVSRGSLSGDYPDTRLSEVHNLRKPDYYLSMEELVERRRQETMRAQGLELVRMIREAEQQGFTADDIQVALTHCGKQSPMEWLQENWRNMVDSVVTLSTNYGNDKKENDIGLVSENEARDALRLHKGNVWAAVTECVEGRQRKYLELSARGKFSRKEILDTLNSSEGEVEIAYAKLSKTTGKPFLMRIWGSGEGVQNEDGAVPMNETFQDIQYDRKENANNEYLSDEIWSEDGEVGWEDEGEYEDDRPDLEDLQTCREDFLGDPQDLRTPESDKSDYCDAFADRNMSSPSDDIFFVIPEVKPEKKKSFLSKLVALRRDSKGKEESHEPAPKGFLLDPTPAEDTVSLNSVSSSEKTKSSGALSAIKNTISVIKETVRGATKTERNFPCLQPEKRTIIVKGNVGKEVPDSDNVQLKSLKYIHDEDTVVDTNDKTDNKVVGTSVTPSTKLYTTENKSGTSLTELQISTPNISVSKAKCNEITLKPIETKETKENTVVYQHNVIQNETQKRMENDSLDKQKTHGSLAAVKNKRSDIDIEAELNNGISVAKPVEILESKPRNDEYSARLSDKLQTKKNKSFAEKLKFAKQSATQSLPSNVTSDDTLKILTFHKETENKQNAEDQQNIEIGNTESSIIQCVASPENDSSNNVKFKLHDNGAEFLEPQIKQNSKNQGEIFNTDSSASSSGEAKYGAIKFNLDSNKDKDVNVEFINQVTSEIMKEASCDLNSNSKVSDKIDRHNIQKGAEIKQFAAKDDQTVLGNSNLIEKKVPGVVALASSEMTAMKITDTLATKEGKDKENSKLETRGNRENSVESVTTASENTVPENKSLLVAETLSNDNVSASVSSQSDEKEKIIPSKEIVIERNKTAPFAEEKMPTEMNSNQDMIVNSMYEKKKTIPNDSLSVEQLDNSNKFLLSSQFLTNLAENVPENSSDNVANNNRCNLSKVDCESSVKEKNIQTVVDVPCTSSNNNLTVTEGDHNNGSAANQKTVNDLSQTEQIKSDDLVTRAEPPATKNTTISPQLKKVKKTKTSKVSKSSVKTDSKSSAASQDSEKSVEKDVIKAIPADAAVKVSNGASTDTPLLKDDASKLSDSSVIALDLAKGNSDLRTNQTSSKISVADNKSKDNKSEKPSDMVETELKWANIPDSSGEVSLSISNSQSALLPSTSSILPNDKTEQGTSNTTIQINEFQTDEINNVQKKSKNLTSTSETGIDKMEKRSDSGLAFTEKDKKTFIVTPINAEMSTNSSSYSASTLTTAGASNKPKESSAIVAKPSPSDSFVINSSDTAVMTEIPKVDTTSVPEDSSNILSPSDTSSSVIPADKPKLGTDLSNKAACEIPPLDQQSSSSDKLSSQGDETAFISNSTANESLSKTFSKSKNVKDSETTPASTKTENSNTLSVIHETDETIKLNLELSSKISQESESGRKPDLTDQRTALANSALENGNNTHEPTISNVTNARKTFGPLISDLGNDNKKSETTSDVKRTEKSSETASSDLNNANRESQPISSNLSSTIKTPAIASSDISNVQQTSEAPRSILNISNQSVKPINSSLNVTKNTSEQDITNEISKPTISSLNSANQVSEATNSNLHSDNRDTSFKKGLERTTSLDSNGELPLLKTQQSLEERQSSVATDSDETDVLYSDESRPNSVTPPSPVDALRNRFEGLSGGTVRGSVRPASPFRRMSFNSRKQVIALERKKDTSSDKPWFLQKSKYEPPKITLPKKSIKQQLEMERRVRKMVADRICRTYRKAEIVVQLMDMNFEEEEAVQAANEYSTLEQALSYLQQECLLCAGCYPVSQMVSMTHCEHMACRECIRAYFTVQIRDRTILDLLCPFCNEPDIRDEDIASDYFNHLDIMLKKLVDVDIHELFQRKLRDRVLMKDPNFRWCSQCSSGFIAMPNLKRLVCPDCNAVTCAFCRRLWERDHQGISCEAFAAMKDANDPEAQAAGLAKMLTEDGIACPDCHFKYALAKGGCMHFRCIQCQHDFCSGCSRPFKMGQKCGVSEFCGKLGLHAHHPRNCLFYLRDKDPEDLQKLLDLNSIEYNRDPPENMELQSSCQVMEQKETADGMIDDFCGKEVMDGYAGLCRLHYVEYLGQLVNKYKVDPIQIFDNDDLELVLRRANIRLPPRRYRESDEKYREKLVNVIQEELPLDKADGS